MFSRVDGSLTNTFENFYSFKEGKVPQPCVSVLKPVNGSTRGKKHVETEGCGDRGIVKAGQLDSSSTKIVILNKVYVYD